MNNLIGHTPIIKINGIWIKCEFMNPTGSSKDRVAYEMLTSNPPQATVIEASSGNTGVSIAFVGSIYCIACKILVPRSTSEAKVEAMRQYGAVVDTNYTNIKEATRAAMIESYLSQIPYINQFNNKYNVVAQTKMAQEIKDVRLLSNHGRKTNPDCIVCGIGTGGTLAGLYKVFPNAVFMTPDAVDFNIEGVSDGVSLPLKPKKCPLTIVDVTQSELHAAKNYLARYTGLWVGDSTVANYIVAKHSEKDFKNILIIGHDNGWRYL